MAFPMMPSSIDLTAAAPARATGKSEPSVHELALSVQAKRLQLIASNIANADTPNYKAVDIDFRDTLRRALESNTAKAASAQPLQPASAALQYVLKYEAPIQRSIDGNTVDMDVERAKLADAVVRYQFALDRVSGHYKEMAKLLADLR